MTRQCHLTPYLRLESDMRYIAEFKRHALHVARLWDGPAHSQRTLLELSAHTSNIDECEMPTICKSSGGPTTTFGGFVIPIDATIRKYLARFLPAAERNAKVPMNNEFPTTWCNLLRPPVQVRGKPYLLDEHS